MKGARCGNSVAAVRAGAACHGNRIEEIPSSDMCFWQNQRRAALAEVSISIFDVRRSTAA